MEQILLLVCAGLGGAMLTLFLRNWRLHSQTRPQVSQATTPEQMEATKGEIETLEFERSILSHSLACAYEFTHGKEMSTGRDRLVTKYKAKLDTINEKIGELQLSAEFTELSEARNKLVSLLQTKIRSLDGRISELSDKYSLSADHQFEDQDMYSEPLPQENKIDPNAIKSTGGMAKFRENESNDTEVMEVQQEILQALNRLENAGKEYELLTNSNKLEANDGKAPEVVTSSQSLKAVENQDTGNGNNVTGKFRSISRDAVSSIIRFKPD